MAPDLPPILGCTRAVLIEAAWVAAPRVPVYLALFDRIHRKTDKRTAIVAVGRRMLEDAWMLLTKEEVFRYYLER